MTGNPLRTAFRLGVIAMLTAGLLACSPDRNTLPTDFQLMVFPGEADLGGSAAAIISSNYIPEADSVELYDLHRDRVEVEITDAGETPAQWDATVRAVFPLAASRTSQLASTRPGAWVTVVLFDLPDSESGFELPDPFEPFIADVTILIDGVPIDAAVDPRAVGSLRITGEGGAGIGGQPTAVLWPPITDLETQSLVARFRPVRDDGSGTGFPEGSVIAGLEADLSFIGLCLEPDQIRPSAATEAHGATIHVGPGVLVDTFMWRARLLMTYPAGFTLSAPAGGGPTALGEGPLIDIAFERPPPGTLTCSGIPAGLDNVYAVDPDGNTVVDERGAPGTSELFEIYEIALE